MLTNPELKVQRARCDRIPASPHGKTRKFSLTSPKVSRGYSTLPFGACLFPRPASSVASPRGSHLSPCLCRILHFCRRALCPLAIITPCATRRCPGALFYTAKLEEFELCRMAYSCRVKPAVTTLPGYPRLSVILFLPHRIALAVIALHAHVLPTLLVFLALKFRRCIAHHLSNSMLYIRPWTRLLDSCSIDEDMATPRACEATSLFTFTTQSGAATLTFDMVEPAEYSKCPSGCSPSLRTWAIAPNSVNARLCYAPTSELQLSSTHSPVFDLWITL